MPKTLFSILLMVTCFALYGQETGSQILVDGALHPELISDDEAAHVLFLSLADSGLTDLQQSLILSTKLQRMNLAAADMSIFADEIRIYKDELLPLEDQLNALRADGSIDAAVAQKCVSLAQEIEGLSVTHYSKLLKRLSPEGAVALTNHLLYVKSRMKIILPPDMSGAK